MQVTAGQWRHRRSRCLELFARAMAEGRCRARAAGHHRPAVCEPDPGLPMTATLLFPVDPGTLLAGPMPALSPPGGDEAFANVTFLSAVMS